MGDVPRILHCHSSFDLGGKEARAVRLINDFGAAVHHVVLSAVPDALGARDAIDAGIEVEFPGDAPLLAGQPGHARYETLGRYMQGFDLVLTYNWGAMDAVMTRRVHGRRYGLPPLIHHEDGFNADEARGQKMKRVWFRRLALGAAHALVVPSRQLEAIARESWKQPPAHVRRIANGIAVARYA
ncbi:MAG: glycosyltransferase, partial [Sphingomonadaceae bacterium]|nr:glycosyltransferase [Sphingomonadaceae bacterium]